MSSILKELPYFGSEQFRQIYLVERICICICICIWIDVFVFVFVFETKLSKIFVFVFVFEKSKFLYLYLYLYLIKRIWPQPWLGAPNPQTQMFLVSSCSCLCPIQWGQVLSREWRCSWSSADRRCSNYIWVIDNFIACQVRLILETWRNDGTCFPWNPPEIRVYSSETNSHKT